MSYNAPKSRKRKSFVVRCKKSSRIRRGSNNTHGLYVLRHTVASRLVSLKGFNAHKLMRFMGHKDIKSSLHYVHLNVEDIRDGVGVCM